MRDLLSYTCSRSGELVLKSTLIICFDRNVLGAADENLKSARSSSHLFQSLNSASRHEIASSSIQYSFYKLLSETVYDECGLISSSVRLSRN